MKYKCFCHTDNVEELTKEELAFMLRSGRKFKPEQFIKYYNISLSFYMNLLKVRGFGTNWRERELVADENKRKREEEENARKNKILSSNDHCVSDFKPIELVAMRMFRDYDRLRFSKISSFKKYEIEWYETGRLPILKTVADEYVEVLQIKERHLIQLREIITGQSKSIVDNRNIPVTIKLKVWKKYKGKCAYCSNEEKLHYHHIKHFSKGGRHTEDNLKLLCVDCHAEEHKGERAYNLIKSMG